MELGDKNLKVQRASIGYAQASGLEMGVNAMSMLAGTQSDNFEEGRVLQLLNMVTPEELLDNEEYEGVFPSCPYTKIIHLLRAQKYVKILRKSATSTVQSLI